MKRSTAVSRFKGILVEKDSYLLELARYIALNPVRAGMVRRPEEWAWSSYWATIGNEGSPSFLATDALLRAFVAKRQSAVATYRRFVAEGVEAPSPWLGLKNQVSLGSEQFVERMRAKIDPARPLQEIPKRQRRPVAKPLAYYSLRASDRDCAIAAAYLTGAYSMQAIGAHFGVSRMTVSRAVKRYENER